jgi:hypothetical protein
MRIGAGIWRGSAGFRMAGASSDGGDLPPIDIDGRLAEMGPSSRRFRPARVGVGGGAHLTAAVFVKHLLLFMNRLLYTLYDREESHLHDDR